LSQTPHIPHLPLQLLQILTPFEPFLPLQGKLLPRFQIREQIKVVDFDLRRREGKESQLEERGKERSRKGRKGRTVRILKIGEFTA